MFIKVITMLDSDFQWCFCCNGLSTKCLFEWFCLMVLMFFFFCVSLVFNDVCRNAL